MSTFIQIFQKLILKKKKKNQTIWLPRVSRIWKIFTSLFKSLLNYKLRQNIWTKIEKSSQVGQYKKSLISTFQFFLTVITKKLMSWRDTGHHLQGFRNSSKGWEGGGIRNYVGEDFLPNERNLRRCNFGNLNFLQS